jgi:LPXTG-motif cell wall-anchored protein
MGRKISVAMFVALATLVAPGVTNANAQNYAGCQAVLSDTTPSPGQTITFSGTGAGPFESVTAKLLGSVIGSGQADANGAFEFSATIPADLAPGTYTVSVSCGPTGGVIGVTIVVGAVAPAPPLPTTGSDDTLPLLRLGIALIAGGAIILAAVRRRTSRAEHLPGG